MNDFNNTRVIDSLTQESALRANKVLRNTYLLLSMTLLFSALTAFIAMQTNAGFMNPIIMIVVYIGLLFGINATKNSPMGIVLTFALTGLLGYSLGPILNAYITMFKNGAELIMMAFGTTGLIFLGLSALAMNPSRNFNRVGSFSAVGAIVALVALVINIFLQLPALAFVISLVFAFISGGFILWQTNSIVRGEENNYVLATVNIYVSLFNIFVTLLQIFGIAAGDKD
ncbi:Bax inhibitor-1/YccA family protein [Allofrancisella guangzhouensis]|uniref:Membrane protein n=1 Tax=Allofrancisella guangzhouensis TaxID=594679 RepID=A0A0A8E6T4_9GAMM|nr:Bax inhibitor-1/YccA family protein [Allofrancisella guangzhouensis]AJC49312.1 membrane protein [Allofrancisella guangzhouensis]MBK2027212.1 Bax inhibitor-1/YccA family protein [Allofrancisella guangzhouensis]MBK2044648.1 Bax inhibitor-1/YccA family protein [Allofrancisella guangzhouensis]MBK2045069.1 Bax inhibitor-1/YccA family protein [Allofrancisella guangzhouensis]